MCNSINKKTNTSREDSQKLRTFLRSLPVCESSNTAKKLAEECKVPLYTFNNWRSGMTRMPELAKDKIEEVIGVKIFEREEF
ncbi:hypothetical protein EZS27_013490 [termite gut metagenome]|uniref:HTH cro/C1-type domain-containing protein n=1 Tax=termite gut metagenome TaxID=433724 RepID=A0A5J4RZ47_9ZZZZ